MRLSSPLILGLLTLTLIACASSPVPSLTPTVAPVAQQTPTTPATTIPTAVPTSTPAPPTPDPQSLLQKIRQRGRLVCGLSTMRPGIATKADTSYAGFAVDFCKAIAVALFDDSTAIEYREVQPDRQTAALERGDVDLVGLVAARDEPKADIALSPAVFYDSIGLMVRAEDLGIEDTTNLTFNDLKGASICAQRDTPAELQLARAGRNRQLDVTVVIYGTRTDLLTGYGLGQCAGVSGSLLDMVVERQSFASPEAHTLLTDTLTTIPFVFAVRQHDPQWLAAVTEVISGTITAERLDVSRRSLNRDLTSTQPEVQQLLGIKGNRNQQLGLAPDIMVRVIKSVGNYGEIYERNVGLASTLTLPRGSNELRINGGRIGD